VSGPGNEVAFEAPPASTATNFALCFPVKGAEGTGVGVAWPVTEKSSMDAPSIEEHSSISRPPPAKREAVYACKSAEYQSKERSRV